MRETRAAIETISIQSVVHNVDGVGYGVVFDETEGEGGAGFVSTTVGPSSFS